MYLTIVNQTKTAVFNGFQYQFGKMVPTWTAIDPASYQGCGQLLVMSEEHAQEALRDLGDPNNQIIPLGDL